MPDQIQIGGDMSPTGASAEKEGYGFRFVEVGEPSKKDEEARSVIRAHVMKDFYDRRRQGNDSNHLPRSLSATPATKGVSQQERRFKNGPQGLQELSKKRRTRTTPLNKAHIRAPRITHTASSPHSLLAQDEDDEEDRFTISGKCASQSPHSSGGVRSVQGDVSDLDSRNHFIELDPLAFSSVSKDPFNTLPLSNFPRTQVLIFHANNSILASPLMGQLRTEWLSLAMKDPAMFHICLSHYAGNYGLTKMENDPAEALRFRMEAMKIVNQRLDEAGSALTDGTIGTVASLSSYEATNGSLVAVRTHLLGLMKMVRLRGGIQNSGMNPYTLRLVLWADLNCANALACDPVFQIPDLHPTGANTRASLRRRSSSAASSEGGNLASLTELQVLQKDLTEDLISLRYLASFSSSFNQRQTIEGDEQIMRSDEVYIIERTLLTISNLCGSRSFVTSCCIAAIIFIDNQLRGVDFIARLMGRHVARLRLSMGMFLDQASSIAAHSTTPRTILWTLYVGAIAAGNRPEHDWFVEQLLEFCDLLELTCWKDTEVVLNAFLWSSAWNLQGSIIWESLTEARMMKNG